MLSSIYNYKELSIVQNIFTAFISQEVFLSNYSILASIRTHCNLACRVSVQCNPYRPAHQIVLLRFEMSCIKFLLHKTGFDIINCNYTTRRATLNNAKQSGMPILVQCFKEERKPSNWPKFGTLDFHYFQTLRSFINRC